MIRYLTVRLIWSLPVIVAILVISFFLTRLAPGDPVTALVGDYPAPEEYVQQMRERFGLDQPLLTQLWLYLSNLLQGNLGFSFVNRQAVIEVILERAGRTLLLMLPALVASSLLGVGVALLAARRPGGAFDSFLTSLVLMIDSIPIFWLGQILIIVFAVNLNWLPAQGMYSMRGGPDMVLLDFMMHWILPGTAVTLAYSVVVARVARASLGEMLNQDFVITAQAKGLNDNETLWKHVLPNAILPVVSVIGYNFGNAITGAILTEAVFSWPGLGSLLVSSITTRDYPVLQGIFLLTSVAVVLANLITDILYGVLDPRVRYGTLNQ